MVVVQIQIEICAAYGWILNVILKAHRADIIGLINYGCFVVDIEGKFLYLFLRLSTIIRGMRTESRRILRVVLQIHFIGRNADLYITRCR